MALFEMHLAKGTCIDGFSLFYQKFYVERSEVNTGVMASEEKSE